MIVNEKETIVRETPSQTDTGPAVALIFGLVIAVALGVYAIVVNNPAPLPAPSTYVERSSTTVRDQVTVPEAAPPQPAPAVPEPEPAPAPVPQAGTNQ